MVPELECVLNLFGLLGEHWCVFSSLLLLGGQLWCEPSWERCPGGESGKVSLGCDRWRLCQSDHVCGSVSPLTATMPVSVFQERGTVEMRTMQAGVLLRCGMSGRCGLSWREASSLEVGTWVSFSSLASCPTAPRSFGVCACISQK